MKHLRSTEFTFQAPRMSAQRRQGYPLSLRKSQATVRLGHLSDIHLGKPPADGVDSFEALARWLEHFADQRVDALVVTGDLVETPGDRARLCKVERALDAAPFPYLVVPGNHDVPEPGSPGPFEEIFGDYPGIEVHDDVEFILFDSMKGLPPADRSLYDRLEAEGSGAYTRGRVGPVQRDALEKQLGEPPDYGRVMLVHHHLRDNAPTETGRRHRPTAPNGLMGPLDDAHDLLDWAHDHHVRLAFHGHKHDFWDPYEPRPGLVVLNSGSSIRGKPDRPRRARLVDVWPGMEAIAVHDLEYDSS